MTESTLKEKLAASAAAVRERLDGRAPAVGIILGSGLGLSLIHI